MWPLFDQEAFDNRQWIGVTDLTNESDSYFDSIRII